jgi:predicted transcriptional regulator
VRQLQVYSGITSLRAITVDKTCLLAFPISFNVETPKVDQTLFNNATRMQIYNFISNSPGVQFRGIVAGLGLSVGLVQYHMGVMVKSKIISFVRDGRYKRYFVSKRFSKKDMSAISLLRHKTAKRIVEALLNKKQLSHSRLAWEVSITSQALTWQMKSLRKTEFIFKANEGLKAFYSLNLDSEPLLRSCLALVK